MIVLFDATGITPTIALLTVVFTMAVGGAWELMEVAARRVASRYDLDPMLVHYGPMDTPVDLLFDGLGVLAVLALDIRIFVPLVEVTFAGV